MSSKKQLPMIMFKNKKLEDLESSQVFLVKRASVYPEELKLTQNSDGTLTLERLLYPAPNPKYIFFKKSGK